MRSQDENSSTITLAKNFVTILMNTSDALPSETVCKT